MEKILMHYYAFEENPMNKNFLKLKSKFGYYKPFEEQPNGMTNFVITLSKNLLLPKKSTQGGQIINPFNTAWIGLADYNNCQDTKIVIFNYYSKSLELFISEQTKPISLIILDLVKTKQLETEIADIKRRAALSCNNYQIDASAIINLNQLQ